MKPRSSSISSDPSGIAPRAHHLTDRLEVGGADATVENCLGSHVGGSAYRGGEGARQGASEVVADQGDAVRRCEHPAIQHTGDIELAEVPCFRTEVAGVTLRVVMDFQVKEFLAKHDTLLVLRPLPARHTATGAGISNQAGNCVEGLGPSNESAPAFRVIGMLAARPSVHRPAIEAEVAEAVGHVG